MDIKANFETVLANLGKVLELDPTHGNLVKEVINGNLVFANVALEAWIAKHTPITVQTTV